MAQLLSINNLVSLAGDALTPWIERDKLKEDNCQSPSATINMNGDAGKTENTTDVQKRTFSEFRRQSVPVTVEWKNISVTTATDKPILKDVSGTVRTGELTAIMGPSGAGKTSLLNVLSGFTRQKLSGQILVNGSNRNMRTFSKLSCYIMQDDDLLPHLTVRETIYMAACLKISTQVSKQEKQLLVEECMQSLGLFECRNSRANQLSGGERKRLCIAQELVCNPPLIFLDEPTSGLDSWNCLQCIQLLKSLAEEGRTIVCVIHQPSAKIFEIFDKLYMLAEGQCIYKGSIRDLIPFLAQQDLTCSRYHNPADFITEVATGQHGDWIQRLKTAVDCLEDWDEGFKENQMDDSSTKSSVVRGNNQEMGLQVSTVCLFPEKVDKKSSFSTEDFRISDGGYATSDFNQFKVLTYRSLICAFREPMTMKLRFVSHLAVGLMMGGIFFDIGYDAIKMYSNSEFLYFSLLFLNFTALMPTVLTFPLEKTVFAREHLNNCYSTKMYFLAKTTAEIPAAILFPTAYCLVVYWMTSQPNDWFRLGIFTLGLITISWIAQSVGLLLGAATTVQNGVFLAPLVCIPVLLFGGIVNLQYVPWYLKWISYVSYMRYAYHSVLQGIYMMGRPQLSCSKKFCPYQEPEEFLEELDMAGGSQYVDYAALLSFFLIFRLAAYCFLRYRVAHNL